MATLVIGDIQGCYLELRKLLTKAGYRQNQDQLWLVGDLINRGPDNVATLKYLMSLDRVVTVLGNHDLHFLAVAHGLRKPGRSDTLNDLLTSPHLDEVVSWLRNQPLIHVDQASSTVLVHAGLPPMWDISACIERAKEVERVLRSDQLEWFLGGMYGNEPAIWDDDLCGINRLRLITNYFTRLRYCTADGRLELTSKANIKPSGYERWFDIANHRRHGYRVLFGHWASLDGQIENPDTIALDTGCVWGRTLTAYRVEDGARFSVESSMPIELEN